MTSKVPTMNELSSVERKLFGRRVRRLGFAAAVCAAIATGVATHATPAAHVPAPATTVTHPYVVISVSPDAVGGPGTM